MADFSKYHNFDQVKLFTKDEFLGYGTGAVMLDGNFKIIEINKGTCQKFGFEPLDLLGEPIEYFWEFEHEYKDFSFYKRELSDMGYFLNRPVEKVFDKNNTEKFLTSGFAFPSVAGKVYVVFLQTLPEIHDQDTADLKDSIGLPKAIDFNEIVYAAMEKIAETHNIYDSFFKIDIDLSNPFYSYKDALFHTFYYLFLKAILFKKDNTQHLITLKALQSGDDRSVKITISDNGQGFQEKDHAQVFSTFDGLSLPQGQNQLGLQSLEYYVKFMGGKIDFSSIPNLGTKFQLSLPDLSYMK